MNIKSLCKYIIYVWLYWMIVFAVSRGLFFLYNFSLVTLVKDKTDIFRSFYKSFEIDNATTCYLLVPIVFTALIYYVTNKKAIKFLLLLGVSFMLFCILFISILDAGLYKEWNAKINFQALEHFKNPSEVFKTVSVKLGVLFVVFMSILFIPFYLFYKKKLHPLISNSSTQLTISKKIIHAIIFIFPFTTIIIIGARGGLKQIPTNQSVCLFSKDVFVNDATINPSYNLLQDITIDTKTIAESDYRVSSNIEAMHMLDSIYTPKKDTTINILTTTKPNIVYIILESFSADLIEVLGGEKDVTPNLNKLSKESILFTNFYASSYVSDQGIPAILSAYPSATKISIINQQHKIPALPCINEELKPLGYTSNFLFGGQLTYGNIKGYLVGKKFDEMKEDVDYTNYPKGALGVHDEYMFDELFTYCSKNKTPFFQCLFTQSTHQPYDYKPQDDFKARIDEQRQFIEAAHYTDIQIGKFFEKAKQQAWYKNTLFVIVADHSHPSSIVRDGASSLRHKIPLYILGGALQEKNKGTINNRYFDQLDITSTILHQLGDTAKRYTWSRNMFNPYTNDGSFYVYYGGVGYVDKEGFVGVYTSYQSNPIFELKDTSLLLNYKLKALKYQQMVYEDFKIR
jgi:phosphoglycerol transferase MdoB-like AlkP superfamily enzyme